MRAICQFLNFHMHINEEKGRHLLAPCIVTKKSSVNPDCWGYAAGIRGAPQGATSRF